MNDETLKAIEVARKTLTLDNSDAPYHDRIIIWAGMLNIGAEAIKQSQAAMNAVYNHEAIYGAAYGL